MRNKTKASILLGTVLAVAIGVAMWSPAVSQSAEPAAESMNMKGMAMDGKAMEGCQKMMDQKRKMMADMKAEGAELTNQIARMNSAPEDQKLSLMAAVITRMAEQRIAMDARMSAMNEEMMQHMMQHMQMDMGSMSQCPMMKGMKDMDMKGMGMKDMKGMDKKTPDAHEGHHSEQK